MLLKNAQQRFKDALRGFELAKESYSNSVIEEGTSDILKMFIRSISTLNLLPSIDTVGKWSYSKKKSDTDVSRVKTTLAKIIRKQFKISGDLISPRYLGYVVEKINQSTFQNYPNPYLTIREKRGEDITEVYANTGVSSCMGGDRSRLVALYGCNPEKIAIVVVYDSRESDIRCQARALLWDVDSGEKVLDRIYAGSDESSRAIVSHARKKGYLVRDNLFSRTFEISGTRTEFMVTVKDNEGPYPYMDTFYRASYAEDDKSHLVLSNNRNYGRYCLDSVNGSGIEYRAQVCERCGNSVDEDDAYHSPDGEPLCGGCHSDACFCCDCCGENSWSSDSHWIESEEKRVCDCCYRENYFYCPNCGENHHKPKETEVDGVIWCESCADNDATECDNCGERSANTDTVDDGNWCEHCVNVDAIHCVGCGDLYPVADTDHVRMSGKNWKCTECREVKATA